MTHLDLFSGIGGFTLAAKALGIETLGFSEIDPYCCAILKKQFPEIENYGDITELPTIPCDLVTAGFPCQPYSVAGKRKGQGDDRYLWPELFAYIQQTRPAWLLLENVVGLQSMGIQQILSDLEAQGYDPATLQIPACAVGAPHRRDRLWILAANLDRQRLQKRQILPAVYPKQEDCFAAKTLPVPALWLAASAGQIGRRYDGLSSRVYPIRALGNAIVPHVALEIIRCIQAAHQLFL